MNDKLKPTKNANEQNQINNNNNNDCNNSELDIQNSLSSIDCRNFNEIRFHVTSI